MLIGFIRVYTGYGVKKLSALDLKSGYFTKLHNKVIKDLKFNPLTQNQLLSVSMDGCVRITEYVFRNFAVLGKMIRMEKSWCFALIDSVPL